MIISTAIVTEITIDTASLALNLDLVKELDAEALNGESGGVMSVEQAYIGLPMQKPFTYTPRFTQKTV